MEKRGGGKWERGERWEVRQRRKGSSTSLLTTAHTIEPE
jgi:hypothetical protein